MADAETRRHRLDIAARAFAARRGQLGLTQEQVAGRAGVVVRTVINFESQGVKPNAVSRAKLERAVGWEAGEIARLAASADLFLDAELLHDIAELTPGQQRRLVDWLLRRLGPDAEPDGRAAREV